MNLFTQVPFPDAGKMIDYESRLVFIGSCFTQEIGGWLSGLKFSSQINPFGITYNPISIARQLMDSLEDRELKKESIQERDGSFFHPDFHSSMNQSSLDAFLENANIRRRSLQEKLKSANFLFLTFGTSIAFEWKKTDEIINNCHRLPSEEFNKVMLSEATMTSQLMTALEEVRSINPMIQIILTVSPIRHLRHGAVQNQRSKARLLKLCESIEREMSECSYLPVYELVMDELRDYRFYRQDDLIHLNEGGLEVIKDRFMTSMIDSASFATIRKVEKWHRSISHRVQNENSDAAKQFKEKLIAMTEELNSELPGRFTKELASLKSS